MLGCHLINSHQENKTQAWSVTGAERKDTMPGLGCKDEWDAKEDTGKSMKNTLYILRYTKIHLSC